MAHTSCRAISWGEAMKSSLAQDHDKLQGDGHEAVAAGGGLELRLGISSCNGHGDGEGLRRKSSSTSSSTPWLGVAVHPWSLAARQEKAALEQAHRRPNGCTVQRESHPSPPPLVGWPPVRTFRKNMSKPAVDEAEGCNKMIRSSFDWNHHAMMSDVIDAATTTTTTTTMFVKVNLEGYAVGRKVDLKAHGSYESLSLVLQSMFHTFLSGNHTRITTKEDDEDEEEEHVETNSQKRKKYILLYVDNEGDRMLVGDVPWELFIASVKRLYIALDTRAQKNTTRVDG